MTKQTASQRETTMELVHLLEDMRQHDRAHQAALRAEVEAMGNPVAPLGGK